MVPVLPNKALIEAPTKPQAPLEYGGASTLRTLIVFFPDNQFCFLFGGASLLHGKVILSVWSRQFFYLIPNSFITFFFGLSFLNGSEN